MSVQDAVRTLIEPPLTAQHLVVDEVAVTATGHRRQVRVTVEKAMPAADGPTTAVVPPLSLDEITEATRIVDAALESSDVMGSSPYVLEVSSPGLSRPLTTADHFRRNVTRLLTVTLVDGTTVTGRLTSADDTTLRLVEAAVKKTPERVHDLALADVRQATVEVEFNRPADDQTGLTDADLGDEHLDDTDDLDLEKD
ncbi:ribosome maturation factor RimP [Kribbia dieselivorans]|uniref:ribosome maturation factor RimP n=1 Tax=Kribbia dieselivorans TaxID=331526 RepID=UPI0008383FF4|nr:hypothetical protein [Kribbia dieselivorans]